ncbi:MAG: glycosyltransferase family 9 protein [Bacteroidota bacterium]|nr:glycosyltransferase family 9 protein [Bacteroidota bacterium]
MIKIPPNKILIIQTAFLGDLVLSTSLIEELHAAFPQSEIDVLVKKGMEEVLLFNPKIHEIITWNKQENKNSGFFKIIGLVRRSKYDLIINCHRFLSSGLICAFSSAKYITGFSNNPFSFLFNKKVPHRFTGSHETERNHQLIGDLTGLKVYKPKIYPEAIETSFIPEGQRYITIAPGSIWFTKKFHSQKWIEFIDSVPENIQIVLLAGKADKPLCDLIKKNTKSPSRICNLAGRLTMLQSAFIMQNAVLNYVNDSGPLHMCSAINAPVCVIYCSTTFSYGFGPLTDFSRIIEYDEPLPCKPCGVHGHQACPKGHFICSFGIKTSRLLDALNDAIKYSKDNYIEA